MKSYFLFKDGKVINYESNKIIELNDEGKNKIKKIVDFIGNLNKDFLEKQYMESMRILNEIKCNFPYIELIPIILEILISQDLKEHQVYFCLKILNSLLCRPHPKFKFSLEHCLNIVHSKYKHLKCTKKILRGAIQ